MRIDGKSDVWRFCMQAGEAEMQRLISDEHNDWVDDDGLWITTEL